jgi:aminopeptidase N
MKLRSASILFIINLFSAVYICAQDWIDLEIEAKSRALERKWELQKVIKAGNKAEYDVGYYGINLLIDTENEKISGSTTIYGKSLTNNLQKVDLDFRNNMSIDSVSGDASSFLHSDDILSIYLQNPLDINEVFKIEIQYNGAPEQGGFMGFDFSYHRNIPVISTLNEPYYAHNWFPCKDMPCDKADSADIIITVPDSLITVSNGGLKEIINNDDGTATYYWAERYPITSYLISLAITNYYYWEDTYVGLDGTEMPVGYWVYPEDTASANRILPITPQMIEFFASIWGEYPFILEKYGQAQFPWGGGMEHQTCTSLGSFSEMLICHELAHQWWGDMVTCANWHHIWLNEGFARYSEALWSEHNYGYENLKDYMNMLNRPDYWNGESVYIQDTTSVNAIFDRIVYDKGAWILHMLRKIVGEDKFWDIFIAYRNTCYMSIATTEDFKNVCEEVTNMDLDWFFNQWVYGISQPHYYISWCRTEISKKVWQIDVSISQIQTTPTLFSMPIDLKIKTEDGDTIFTIWDSLQTQGFTLICNSYPESLILDPDSWVLKTATYSMVDPDLGYIPNDYILFKPHPNPFNSSTYFSFFILHDDFYKISVYDILGREIDIIRSDKMRAGYYQDMEWKPLSVSSGVYIIRLEGRDVWKEQKVLYIK